MKETIKAALATVALFCLFGLVGRMEYNEEQRLRANRALNSMSTETYCAIEKHLNDSVGSAPSRWEVAYYYLANCAK